MPNRKFSSGDVLWAPDPYNAGGNPRPWLVLSADNIPYNGEEYICAGLTLSDLPDNLEVRDIDWTIGEPNETSYCSPWVLATVKHDDVQNPQGTLTDDFTSRIIQLSVNYVAGDLGDFSTGA